MESAEEQKVNVRKKKKCKTRGPEDYDMPAEDVFAARGRHATINDIRD